MSFFGLCCAHFHGQPVEVDGIEVQRAGDGCLVMEKGPWDNVEDVGLQGNPIQSKLVEPYDTHVLENQTKADELAGVTGEAQECQRADETKAEVEGLAATATAKVEKETPPKETDEERVRREERDEEEAIRKMEERMQTAKKKKKQGMSLKEWEVTITKPKSGGSLGVGLLDYKKAHIVVSNIDDDGIVMDFNDTQAEEGQAILPGTVIVSCNGSTSKAECVAALKRDDVLNLKVQRVVSELVVPLADKGRLGLDLDANTAEVKQVKRGGSIYQYNQTCEVGYEVVPTDLVVAVNKLKGEPEKIMNSIRSATGDIKLTFARLGGERYMNVARMPTLLGEDGEDLVES